MQKYFVHDTAIVEDGASIGENSKIWHFVHIRKGAKIGKNCIFGKNVYVDEDVVIGNGCKFQNNVNVYKGVYISDNVFVGPNATFTNDLYPKANIWDESRLVKTYVGEGVSIGAQAVIICGITINKYAMVGSGSVVTKDVSAYTLVVGNPAKPIGFVCECGFPLKEKVREEKSKVVLRCSKCGREISIDKILYLEVKGD